MYTVEEALNHLKEGNKRFAEGKSIHPRVDIERRKETARHGQAPFATVLACSDSRVPVELLFDRGIGDIFVICVAGNVPGSDVNASIEYAINYLRTPVCVVLGHEDCGAIKTVVTQAKVHGHITELAEKIRPAVEEAKQEHPHLLPKDIVSKAVRVNIWKTIETLLNNSDIIKTCVKRDGLKLAGAVYDIESGLIEWLGEHPKLGELIE